MAGISPRSLYAYAERGLLPPAVRHGRRLLYTEEHREALRLVRILSRLGLPTRRIQQLVVGQDDSAIRRALAPVLPLATLLDEAEERINALQQKFHVPRSDELDLENLGLEDPVRLGHQLGEAERQRERLQTEFERAGQAVLRELVRPGEANAPTSSVMVPPGWPDDGLGPRELFEDLKHYVRGGFDRLEHLVRDQQRQREQVLFLAGLRAAHAAGWIVHPSVPTPANVSAELAQVFRSFVEADAAPATGSTVPEVSNGSDGVTA